ncbi:MAG: hypothetical protein M3354_06375 [Chloroflexota bacterium]|nr:hypothetical protein [Chloroflexota bacterium]
MPASALREEGVAVLPESLVVVAKRPDLDEERGGHLVVIDRRDPLLQCDDISLGRISVP